ncbi:D-inositol-3-phosphate glycosyltransferase [Gemmata sp. SH-PL17]|nr:D-inositol-3-phosphate glycosyltransferase [Gemmata sp. SH-PL17]
MRLVALVESESHVCCRYRLTAFHSALVAAGHTLDFQPLPQSLFGRAALGRDLTSYDAIILQRKLLPRWVIALLRRRVQRLIFDFDDAVWLRDSYSTKGFNDPKRAARFRATIQACDLVVAGNAYLAEEARKFVPANRITVIPTCVDVTKYHVRERTSHDSALRLVWVGSASTLQGLERFGPTLSAIGRAVPGARLKLICDRFTEFPDLPVERCTWVEATEAAEIALADIGIGWVPDDPWSRGKCALKVLQYQAAGLPVVANPVGVQADFVRDGETGFRANSTGEWVRAIQALAADVGMRKRLGETARCDVETHYSVEAGARLWIGSLARFGTTRMAG